MARIGTYGASQTYLARLSEIQQRVYREQIQVTTELKSQNYTGISRNTNTLLNFENEMSRAQQFLDNNAIFNTRLEATEVSMKSLHDTINTFRTQLNDFNISDTLGREDVENLQKWAFQAMKDMESYLAAEVDGQYLFSGGRITTVPVELPFDTLAEFQAMYDGRDKTYPTSRAAQMLDLTTKTADTGNLTFNAANGTITAANAGTLSDIPVGSRVTAAGATTAGNNQAYTVIANTGTQITVSRLTSEATAAHTLTWDAGKSHISFATTGALTFSPGADTLTAATAGSLTGLDVGDVFTVSGTAGNDGTYQVKANDGTTLTIESTKVAATETVAATLSATSWYKGDTQAIQHRVDKDRTLEMNVVASDPAFEKAFRALGLIAQGEYGTDGGLEANWDRIEQALYLIRDSLEHPAANTPPNGLPATEMSSDMTTLRSTVGTMASTLRIKNEKHESYIGFLTTRIATIEQIDKTEAITALLDDQNALEASYQALSRVRDMSLLKYMQ